MLVVEAHRLPLEFTHLMERLHLDPFDVLHGCDESGDTIDVRGIVGFAGNQREANPNRLGERGKPLGKAKGGRQDRGRSPDDRCRDSNS